MKKMFELLKQYKKIILIFCLSFIFLIVVINSYFYFNNGLARVKANFYLGDKISVTITSTPWRDVSTYSVYWQKDCRWEEAAKHKRNFSIKGGSYRDYKFKAILEKSQVLDKYEVLLADYPDEIEVYFGFLNTNSWQIVNIYLYPELLEDNGKCYLKLTQTVVYTGDYDYVSCNTIVDTFNLSENEKIEVWLGLT